MTVFSPKTASSLYRASREGILKAITSTGRGEEELGGFARTPHVYVLSTVTRLDGHPSASTPQRAPPQIGQFGSAILKAKRVNLGFDFPIIIILVR